MRVSSCGFPDGTHAMAKSEGSKGQIGQRAGPRGTRWCARLSRPATPIWRVRKPASSFSVQRSSGKEWCNMSPLGHLVRHAFPQVLFLFLKIDTSFLCVGIGKCHVLLDDSYFAWKVSNCQGAHVAGGKATYRSALLVGVKSTDLYRWAYYALGRQLFCYISFR